MLNRGRKDKEVLRWFGKDDGIITKQRRQNSHWKFPTIKSKWMMGVMESSIIAAWGEEWTKWVTVVIHCKEEDIVDEYLFQYKWRLYIWKSFNERTRNQIDFIPMEKRWKSKVSCTYKNISRCKYSVGSSALLSTSDYVWKLNRKKKIGFISLTKNEDTQINVNQKIRILIGKI